MALLNFIDTGFIIILAILLLISGGIMFYCYRRLNLLEESMINQGKILQNLISNLQNYNNNEESYIKNEIYNDAINNKEIDNEEINIVDELQDDGYKKLQVSDDGYKKLQVSDDDSSDSESSSGTILDNVDDIVDDEVNEDDEVDIDDEVDEDDDVDENNMDDKDSIGEDNDTKLLEKSLIDISMKVKENEDKLKVLEISDDIINNISDQDFITNNIKGNNENKKNEIKNRSFNKMKVDELKQLVFDKNLNSEEINYEEINSMKKNDLIKLLTK